MIQILLTPNPNYSLPEMVQMAVEAGCGWLILPEDADSFRDEITDIIEMCRDAGIILTIRNNIEAAKEYGLHGLMLDLGKNPVGARQELGAEAIIGAIIADAAAATALSAADIDYFILDPLQSVIVGEAQKAGVENHFVALCNGNDIDKELMDSVRADGFSGICADSSIFSVVNPVDTIANLVKSI